MKEPYERPTMLTEKVEPQKLVASGSAVAGQTIYQQAFFGLCCL